ncbi:MAG: O-antigen ligase family protein [Acetatifactor sp.]|nr:O-antigen ligase family protein [Acetatifactor sp.]
MEKKAREYMEALANGYIILILGVLPLYMKDGFNMIGDAKYLLFIRSALLLFCLSAAGAAVLLAVTRKKKCGAMRGTGQGIAVRWPKADRSLQWSLTDSFVLLYGISTVISYCFSEFRQEAFWGYVDWHMGLMTQLLLVWSYFFISRFYKREKFAWKVAGAAAFLVFLLGVLNRYSCDVIGTYREIDYWDWNRRHLLSTIGNINWYCSYACLMCPLLLYLFWSRSGGPRMLGGVGSFIGFAAIFTQGSSSGFLGLGASMAVLLWASLKDQEKLKRFFQLFFMMSLMPPLLARTSEQFLPYELKMPKYDLACQLLFWKIWYVAMALSGFAILFLYVWQKRGGRDFLKSGAWRRVYTIAVAVILLAGASFILLCQLSEGFWKLTGSLPELRIQGEWGSGRGALWKVSVQCFLQSGWKQRLLGAGPDCFAGIIYKMFDMNQEIFMAGQWQGAIFANAHNEWLNMLITGGLLGAALYAGIFICSFMKCRNRAEKHPVMIAGMMMIAGYAANNFFGFQQAVAAPVMFVVLGMLSAIVRFPPLKCSAKGSK